MIAIEGGTTTLTCSLQGSSFQWYKLTNSSWSLLQQSAKYGNVNTGYLAIYNVDQHDGGRYVCTTGSQHLHMNIVFRGTQSKLEKCSQTKPINAYALRWSSAKNSERMRYRLLYCVCWFPISV